MGRITRTFLPMMMFAVCSMGSALWATTGDFNGDGRDDIAILSPADDDGGAMNVLYGRNGGLKATGDQYFTKATPGLAGPAVGTLLAFKLAASGDFNGDGFDDLAAGSPLQTLDGVDSTGAVNVLYGSSNGLSLVGDQFWHLDSAGVKGEPEVGANFGNMLAAGDFDGDGYDDLAITSSSETYLGITGAGVVHILYGSRNGLTAAGDQIFSQSAPGIADVSEPGDAFGSELTVGDFDGDGFDDLAIGIENEEVDGESDAGAVAVIYGSSSGLTAAGDQFWHQNVTGIRNQADIDDDFGVSLAAGDFDGDGYDDLTIGIEEEIVNGVGDAGAVAVIYGSASGLRAAGNQLLHQNSPGIQDKAEEQDQFGSRLVAGDFDGDGFDDLAVGIEDESIGVIDEAGAVAILYGGSKGLSGAGDQFLHQNAPGVSGSATTDEGFGTWLYAGDFDGDGRTDLGVSTPGELVGGHEDAGTVTVFYGSGSGISVKGEQVWSQDSPGVIGESQDNELFGTSVFIL